MPGNGGPALRLSGGEGGPGSGIERATDPEYREQKLEANREWYYNLGPWVDHAADGDGRETFQGGLVALADVGRVRACPAVELRDDSRTKSIVCVSSSGPMGAGASLAADRFSRSCRPNKSSPSGASRARASMRSSRNLSPSRSGPCQVWLKPHPSVPVENAVLVGRAG
jgi:hypothetical protein